MGVSALTGQGAGELIRRGAAWAAGLDPARETAASTRPRETESWRVVSMPDFLNVIKKRGFIPVGRVVIDKSIGNKTFATGHFEQRQEPKRKLPVRQEIQP